MKVIMTSAFRTTVPLSDRDDVGGQGPVGGRRQTFRLRPRRPRRVPAPAPMAEGVAAREGGPAATAVVRDRARAARDRAAKLPTRPAAPGCSGGGRSPDGGAHDAGHEHGLPDGPVARPVEPPEHLPAPPSAPARPPPGSERGWWVVVTWWRVVTIVNPRETTAVQSPLVGWWLGPPILFNVRA
jgi:hypothetical protein